jgi:hypothetical protein
VKNKVADFCSRFSPMRFYLLGTGNFPEGINYLSVQSNELLNFNNGLERTILGEVNFVEKLNKEKLLHITIPKRIELEFPIQDCMRYLTGIKNKKIWFVYDLLEKRIIERDEALNVLKN